MIFNFLCLVFIIHDLQQILLLLWVTRAWLFSASPSKNGRSFLHIHHALRQDAGMYTCIAENPAGLVTASAPVLMKGDNKLPLFHKIQKIT